MSAGRYNRSVFMNCPFDRAYKPVFDALVFAVYCADLVPRCALELDDAAEIRLDKIFRMVGECRYGIHDISRTEADPSTGLPRFNMPLELGIFLAGKRFGDAVQSRKRCLILDRELYRYQKFLSDISGQDIHAHGSDPRRAVGEARAWLRTATGRAGIPGGQEIWSRYLTFRRALPGIGRKAKLRPEEWTFVDYTHAVWEWMRLHP